MYSKPSIRTSGTRVFVTLQLKIDNTNLNPDSDELEKQMIVTFQRSK